MTVLIILKQHTSRAKFCIDITRDKHQELRVRQYDISPSRRGTIIRAIHTEDRDRLSGGRACNLVLADTRETLCISLAHIDTFIPRDRSLTTKYLSFKQHPGPGSPLCHIQSRHRGFRQVSLSLSPSPLSSLSLSIRITNDNNAAKLNAAPDLIPRDWNHYNSGEFKFRWQIHRSEPNACSWQLA